MYPGRIIIVLFLLTAWIYYSGKTDTTVHSTYRDKVQASEETPVYKVVRIKDGDTFVLLADNQEQVVRLAHIDCPEKKQPFASKAKQFASDLCFGKYVTVQHHNQYDRYRRLIAEIILPDGRNVNRELIKEGLAWHFKKYSADTNYAVLEIKAREEKTGLWSEKNPIAPWMWRKRK